MRAEAVIALDAAASLQGRDLAGLEALAFLAFGLGAHEVARLFYARTVEILPKDATAWYNLASAQRTLGHLSEAEQSCDRALTLDPGLVQAALLRSELRKQSADANHVDQLKAWLAKVTEPSKAIALNYALGKELDDLGDYPAAFHHFGQGAAIRRRHLQYDVEQDVWKLQRIEQVFDATLLAKAVPLQPARFGFILGLPRSGTTLIERVLTGNPDVATNGETDNLLKALMDGSSPQEADIFKRLAHSDPEKVRRSYARRAHDPAGRRLVLEKLPFNYLYAGAIRLTMPDSRMILLARAPADNCFAMFSTLFGAGYPFSYDQIDLARYYVAYRQLIGHWKSVLGEQLVEVSYENFVSHPAVEGARLAAHIGVDWDETMLKIEQNRAASATASAAQIRRPIYDSARGRWRNYETQLAPLLDALFAAGIDPEAS